MARSAVLPTHPSGPGCRHLMPARLAPGVAPALLGAMTECPGVRSGAPGALYPPVKANKSPTLLHSRARPKTTPRASASEDWTLTMTPRGGPEVTHT